MFIKNIQTIKIIVKNEYIYLLNSVHSSYIFLSYTSPISNLNKIPLIILTNFALISHTF